MLWINHWRYKFGILNVHCILLTPSPDEVPHPLDDMWECMIIFHTLIKYGNKNCKTVKVGGSRINIFYVFMGVDSSVTS